MQKENCFKLDAISNQGIAAEEYFYQNENSSNINNEMMREIDEIAGLLEDQCDSLNNSSL